MSVIGLLNAEAGSTPSGTGSFTYFTNLAKGVSTGVWFGEQRNRKLTI